MHESGGDRVRCDVQARGEVTGRERLDVVVPKGVRNCGEESVNKICRVASTEYLPTVNVQASPTTHQQLHSAHAQEYMT